MLESIVFLAPNNKKRDFQSRFSMIFPSSLGSIGVHHCPMKKYGHGPRRAKGPKRVADAWAPQVLGCWVPRGLGPVGSSLKRPGMGGTHSEFGNHGDLG